MLKIGSFVFLYTTKNKSIVLCKISQWISDDSSTFFEIFWDFGIEMTAASVFNINKEAGLNFSFLFLSCKSLRANPIMCASKVIQVLGRRLLVGFGRDITSTRSDEIGKICKVSSEPSKMLLSSWRLWHSVVFLSNGFMENLPYAWLRAVFTNFEHEASTSWYLSLIDITKFTTFLKIGPSFSKSCKENGS